MALSEFTRHEVERKLGQLCQRRSLPPERIRVGFRFRGNSVTLFQERPSIGGSSPPQSIESLVAQFRLNPDSQLWQIYCVDRNRRWHRYTRVAPTRSFELLIKEIEEDPTGIFWG